MIKNPFKRTKSAATLPSAPSETSRASMPAAERAFPGKRRIFGVLIAPHLTEKTARAGGERWYAFRVSPGAGKILVKQAVEDRYRVKVERVRMFAPRAKQVRLGRIEGTSPGFRKAMVKIAAGEKIDFS